LGFRVSKSWPKLTDFGQLLYAYGQLTGKKLAEIRCCRLSSSLLLLCFVFFSSIARKEQMAKKLDFGKTTGIKEHDDDSKYVIL